MTILVTGATGNIGRHVVRNLLIAGADVRALTRNPDSQLPAGVEVVPGDLAEPASLAAALDGVHAMYLFPVLDAIDVLVEDAKRAGVRRIVFLSGAWAAGTTQRDRDSWTYPRFRAAEAVVESGGVPEWTILRPGPFATNLLWWRHSIRAEGVVRAPYGASVCPLIHEADIADIATSALTEDRHIGRRYTLTGPESISQFDQAAAIGAAIGTAIGFEELTAAQWRTSVSTFLRAGIIDDLLRYWSETAADPTTAPPVSPTFTELTGKPGRGIAEWAIDHRADFS